MFEYDHVFVRPLPIFPDTLAYGEHYQQFILKDFIIPLHVPPYNLLWYEVKNSLHYNYVSL